MTRRPLFTAVLAGLVVSATLAQSPAPKQKVGVLDGYSLFSIGPGSVKPSARVDIRRVWDENLFFRSPRQLEKQGRTYPSASILAGALDGRFLANLWGLEYRDDGPLVLSDIRTGKVVRTFAVSGSSIVAGFVPPDDRTIVASWGDSDGGSHQAVFDASSGQLVTQLPAGHLPPSGILFCGNPVNLLFMPESSGGAPAYELLPVSSWRDAKPLSLPPGNYTVLDAEGDSFLLESRAAMITISAWSSARPTAAPVVINTSEYGGDKPAQYRLTAHGQRVMRWSEGASNSEVVIYDTSNARVVGRTSVPGSIRAHAVDSEGMNVAVAAGRSIITLDGMDGAITGRNAVVLSPNNEVSLFWFR